MLPVYAATLGVGLLSMDSPGQPISGAIFTALELLIIAMGPAMLGLMVAVHACAPPALKPMSALAVLFMGLVVVTTSTLHSVILVMGRSPATEIPGLARALSFQWPSVAYAIDILAWDLFFPLAMFCAAPVFAGARETRTVHVALLASGALALAGLAGAVLGDMRIRNIGILGYVVGFFITVLVLASVFRRTMPVTEAHETRLSAN